MPTRAKAEQLEKLLGLLTDFDAKPIAVVVANSGCTSKGDFRSEVKDGIEEVFP